MFYIKAVKVTSNNKGVTLIELLVVITIMMTMVALVAPLTINTIDKAEAQSEYLTFCGLLRKASAKAFSNGARIEVVLQNEQLKMVMFSRPLRAEIYPEEALSEQILHKNFKYLYFPDETIRFNQNGMANIPNITIKQRSNQKYINLIDLLHN